MESFSKEDDDCENLTEFVGPNSKLEYIEEFGKAGKQYEQNFIKYRDLAIKLLDGGEKELREFKTRSYGKDIGLGLP